MRPKHLTFVVPVIVWGVSAAACIARDTGRRYQLTGIVQPSASPAGRVTVAHEAIEGFMPAMTMAFDVRGDRPALGAGDRITATLVVTESQSWLEGLAVSARAATGAPAGYGGAQPDSVGAAVPDFELTDQDGRPLRLTDLRGRVVVLTFIYTRCPLPDYCPRMMNHLNAIKRALEPERKVWPRVHLVAVTIDPAHDTPAVLREYGARFISGENRFSNVSLATGEPAMIQALAGFFGVRYREEANQISHSLATGVIAGSGRVAAILPSNTWSAEDAVAIVRREVSVLR